MWYNRRLRTRLLLGYGLILGLASALALFLVLRVDALNQSMQELNTNVAAEAKSGIHLTTDLATIQQSVNHYLQQPEPAHLQKLEETLSHLTTEIDTAQATLANPDQRALLGNLKRQLQVYHTTFESVSRLLEEQEPIRRDLNTHLARASTLLSSATAQVQRSDADPALISQLAEAQSSLQQASIWIIRLTNESSKGLGANAIAELSKASLVLKRNTGELDSATTITIDTTLNEIALVTTLTNQLIESIEQVEQQRDTSLTAHGNALSRQVEAISGRAINNLNTTTNALAGQTRRVQQIAAFALLTTLVLALVLSIGLTHTITRPLRELVVATTRLTQGDYDVTVSRADGSEIGQLAATFNQMTTTLKQQRAEMLAQQEAIRNRNQELEQALAEVRVATEERTALAATVRTLSVPVVPILDNVIVVSLVGEIDEQRARTLLSRLLDGITAQHAKIAILDITGVPFVDPLIVEWLLKVAHAANLLGARCLLVGIRPEVAQAIVASGSGLGGLITKATLRDAVEYALLMTAPDPRFSPN